MPSLRSKCMLIRECNKMPISLDKMEDKWLLKDTECQLAEMEEDLMFNKLDSMVLHLTLMFAVQTAKLEVISCKRLTKFLKTVSTFASFHISVTPTAELKLFGKLSESFKHMLSSIAQSSVVIFATEKSSNT